MRVRVVTIVIILLVPYLHDLPSFSLLDVVEATEIDPTIEVPNEIRLQEICPGNPVEFITLMNFGEEPIDLDGIVLSDREGSLTFISNSTLQPRGRVTIAQDGLICASYMPMESIVEYSSEGIEKKGRFALADDGDQVLLLSQNGSCLDMFVYGSAPTYPPWDGVAFPNIPSGGSARRLEIGSSLTLDATCWSGWAPGRSELMPWNGTGRVQALIYPDNALEKVLTTLQKANQSVHLCVYDLDHPDLVGCLLDAEGRGLEVQVLLEGQPVTGLSPSSAQTLNRLGDAGVDVRVSRSSGSYQRYDYLHCKYAVVDHVWSIIGSENWNQDAFVNNRGWGILVESRGLAEYLIDLIHEDLSLRYGDVIVRGEPEVDDHSESAVTCAIPNSESALEVWTSPDNSLPSLLCLLRSAQERILIQSLDCDLTWLKASGIWNELEAASARGVEVRMLLDTSFEGTKEDNCRVVQAISSRDPKDPNFMARLVSEFHEFRTLHNKGMVVDQVALVSSINLVRSAFQDNRELALLTDDPTAVDLFAATFWKDWELDPLPPVIEGVPRSIICGEGQTILNASDCKDAAGIDSIQWDINNDGTVDAWGEKIMARFPVGQHLVLLSVRDGHGNTATTVIVVQVYPHYDAGLVPYIPLTFFLVVVVSPIIWSWRKRIKRG